MSGFYSRTASALAGIYFKGAVCKFFFTLLKHKNTIMCLQIFRKHAKFTICFSERQSYMSECLFLFWSVIMHIMPVYPIVFQHHRLPDGRKHSILQPWKPANKLGASGVGSDRVSVSMEEGDSVTLYTGVKTNQQEVIKWYCNDTRIAQISGDFSYICTDVQCNKGTERFRDRLKLDHQTGSLTIMNIRTEDSCVYELKTIRSVDGSDRILNVFVSGVSAADRDEVKRKSVMEGESVTFDPGVMKNTNDSMMWYFNDVLIAEITGDQSQICADDQCKERFRDRLKLDHQTGALTITHTTNTDPGEYKLQFIRRRIIKKIFNVDVSAAERDEVKRKSVMEGESVTLDPGVMKNTNDSVMWYFNDVLIAEITGDQSQICADDQCKERFRDRLKLDHQTGALTITHTTNTDAGEYKLQMMIINSSVSITRGKRFSVSVTGSGLSAGAVAGIVVGVLLVFAAAGAAAGIYYHHPRRHTPTTAQNEDDNL
ncbi:uncharacterized protein [Pseudorasbora parva]|uniref:uncharacterized protein n=1 Tax=Pseudorasbora parva TaxID=51549 RepID=UPI00351DD717